MFFLLYQRLFGYRLFSGREIVKENSEFQEVSTINYGNLNYGEYFLETVQFCQEIFTS